MTIFVSGIEAALLAFLTFILLRAPFVAHHFWLWSHADRGRLAGEKRHCKYAVYFRIYTHAFHETTMSEILNPVARLSDLSLEPFSRGEHYASQDAGLGGLLGLTQLGACYTEVPPGKSACPFHVHHNEDELFVIIEGEGEYRFGERHYAVRAGDVLGAPRGGPEYAHKLVNTGDASLKYLAISSVAESEICEYPDSGKFGVFGRRDLGAQRRFRFLGRESDSMDYWDGEPDAR